ncbi:helix-turn-helix domain-containing protein [Neobacillus cucumis]|uniref:V4R domain-containing protein n=1 Tax=Neobacillus cucumis TaxID=1740721 RepID=UPI00203C98B1|nr:V4R domain-containing protein [Neobacillus cucumis]MCM3729148.1 helix-turn-helix domain-containing protein [Neobacillus cucumis]
MSSQIVTINKTTFQSEYDIDYIVMTRAIAHLRNEILNTVDDEKARELMFNYGYELGKTEAMLMKEKYFNIKELINQGPICHCKKGHFTGSIFEGYIELYGDDTIKTIQGTGTWQQSFEAMEHLKQFGQSDKPVCDILIGFASGYLSTVCQFKVNVVEKTCVGKGDENCTWDIYTVQPLVAKSSNDHTQEKNFDLIELSNIQNKLIQSITDGASIEEVLQQAFLAFDRKFVIEDIFFNVAHCIGLDKDEKNLIQQDMYNYDQQQRQQLGANFFEQRQQLAFNKKVITLDHHTRLCNTIVIQNKVVAYLSIISVQKNQFTSNDYLILTQFTNVVSILLLANQIKTNSSEMNENRFTHNLINKKHTSYNEILSKSRFFNIDVNEKYTIAILRWNKNISPIQQEIEHYLQKQLSKYRILITNKELETITIIFHRLNNEEEVGLILKHLYQVVCKQFPKHPLQIGYSNIGHSINEANSHYHEASLALFSNSKNSIAAFQNISILSIFLNESNSNHIIQISKHKFAPILTLKEQKSKELLQTLYVYLNNNLKIETTMRILNISKSGLLYRLDNIKNYLETDLKDPNENFQYLLLLKAIEISSHKINLTERGHRLEYFILKFLVY